MSFRGRAVAVAPLLIGYCLVWGCTPTNEEGFEAGTKSATRKEGTPDFKSYSEVMQYQAQQAAKNNPGKAASKKAH